jgi:uroporphyrinogen decarboxylase
MALTHRERLQACLADDPALDRPPVALWRHFPVDDQEPESLAAATIAYQQQYEFDLVKVTPASSFCLKDWGAVDVWTGDTEGTRLYTGRVIENARDWERLPTLDPGKASHLKEQLACLRLLRAGIPIETPILQTVFSPLSQAKNLAGGTKLITHLRQHPDAVLKGLAVIAETTRRFVEACLETGIDGIFFAVQHAQAGLLTREEFRIFSLPFDLQVCAPARELWCNLLHLHGEDVYFDMVGEYPCQVVNWHDRETPPTLAEARKTSQGTLCGGISQNTIVYGDRNSVQHEAGDALAQTSGRRFILGTGCVVPVIAPHGNILTTRRSVEKK